MTCLTLNGLLKSDGQTWKQTFSQLKNLLYFLNWLNWDRTSHFYRFQLRRKDWHGWFHLLCNLIPYVIQFHAVRFYAIPIFMQIRAVQFFAVPCGFQMRLDCSLEPQYYETNFYVKMLNFYINGKNFKKTVKII